MIFEKLDIPYLRRIFFLGIFCWITSCAAPEETLTPEGKATTVDALLSKGAQVLTSEEITELIVGKTLRITDLRNGEKYDVFFGEDGTRTVMDTVTTVQSDSTRPTVNHYEVKNDRLFSSLDGGTVYYSQIFLLDDHYYASRSDQEGFANYEILGINEGSFTISSLKARGGVQLTDEELQELLVGKTITVLHLVTGEIFEISYTEDGIRTPSNVDEDEEFESKYQIVDGHLEIEENGEHFSGLLFRLGFRYFGARSHEEGFISYEILSSRE